jgi:hypothetical protein
MIDVTYSIALRIALAGGLLCGVSVGAAPEVPMIKGDPKRAHEVLGQFKHWECRKNASDSWTSVETRSLGELKKTALGYSTRSRIDAVVNVVCEKRFDGKLIAGCEEAVKCEGDYVLWR